MLHFLETRSTFPAGWENLQSTNIVLLQLFSNPSTKISNERLPDVGIDDPKSAYLPSDNYPPRL